jgi:hypothetical protein
MYQVIVGGPVVDTCDAAAVKVVLWVGSLLPCFQWVCIKVETIVNAHFFSPADCSNDTDHLVTLKKNKPRPHSQHEFLRLFCISIQRFCVFVWQLNLQRKNLVGGDGGGVFGNSHFMFIWSDGCKKYIQN